jgi:hypothetical protein
MITVQLEKEYALNKFTWMLGDKLICTIKDKMKYNFQQDKFGFYVITKNDNYIMFIGIYEDHMVMTKRWIYRKQSIKSIKIIFSPKIRIELLGYLNVSRQSMEVNNMSHTLCLLNLICNFESIYENPLLYLVE